MSKNPPTRIVRLAQAEKARRERQVAMKGEAEESLLSFVRMMWPILEPSREFRDGWIIDCLVDVLTSISDGYLTRVCINVPPGSMKALACDTPVLTTWGWKPHGDLRRDDFVFGPDGKPKRVLAVTEHAVEPCRAVVFDDGATIIAGEGHKWQVERDYPYGAPGGRRIRKTEIVSTVELVPSVAGRALERPDRIGLTQPLAMAPRRLLVDPYILGAWLGDGSTASAHLNVGHEDIEHFRKFGRISMTLPPDERRKQPFYRIALDGVQERLRILGILGDKHIPDDYLESSIEQRSLLLRGLMDTDGCATVEGTCTYTTKLEGLAEDVHGLACSLGLKATLRETWSNLNGIKHGPYYTISFTPPVGAIIFNLERKQARLTGNQNVRSRGRYVASIGSVGQTEVNCICVEGGLYLAGFQFVTTHNSSLLNVLWPAWEWTQRPDLRYVSISYSDKVPTRDNLRFSMLVRHPVFQTCWGDRIKIVQDGAEMVRNDRTGWKMISGTSGSVTGFRGDRLLLDDLNNPENVESEIVRQGTERFVREIMPSRLNDLKESVIVNLQQRTHEMDATGVIMKNTPDDWTFVCVPAEFDPLRIFPVTLAWDERGAATDVWVDPRSLDANGNTLLGLTTNERGEPAIEPGSAMARAFGESFWPERFPEEALNRLKRGMTPYSWDSQYNQIPGIRGGALVRRDWWKLWRGAAYPEVGTVIVSVDTAIEEQNHNDYNACTVWGAFAGDSGEPLLLLMGGWRVRLPLAQLVAKVADTAREHRADYLLIEHKTRGRDVHDEIIRLYTTRSWQTILVKADQSKFARLKAVEHLFSGDFQRIPTGLTGSDGKPEMIDNWSGGIIYAPDKDWADEIINEVASFPYGQNDDYVDTVSMAVGWFRQNGGALRRIEWDDQETERKTYRKPQRTPYAIAR